MATPGYFEIGAVDWESQAIVDEIDAFLEIYAGRPFASNPGGMGAPHCLYLWFLLRRLQPAVVIESGVFRGQSTWLIEQAAPQAEIHAIDPRLDVIEYRSQRARYSAVDFADSDWRGLDAAGTVVFFDDHQNAYERLLQCRWMGFRHLVFEDNYPAGQGDCYSLKKVFAGAGHTSAPARGTRRGLFGRRRGRQPLAGRSVAASAAHGAYAQQHLDIYYEFPPVVRTARTRWGDEWSDERYPTKAALFDADSDDPRLAAFRRDAETYTWFSYARLANATA